MLPTLIIEEYNVHDATNLNEKPLLHTRYGRGLIGFSRLLFLGVFFIEFLDTTCCINKLHLTGEEWMAGVADL